MKGLESLIKEIEASDEQFLVLSHVSPDPDAVGSAMGLSIILQSLGKKGRCLVPGGPGRRIERILETSSSRNLFSSEEKYTEASPLDTTTIFVVDTATKARVNCPDGLDIHKARRVVVIDHHISNPAWGDFNLIVGDAPSTTTILATLAQRVLGEGDLLGAADLANFLLAGLMDDTGCFRFSNTTPLAHETAAWLLNTGADLEFVSNELYFTVPERVLSLRKLALPQLRTEFKGKLGGLLVSIDMLETAGAGSEDSEGLIDEVRSIDTVKVAFMAREQEPGRWKVSFRSKDSSVDVNRIASNFGGGGHAAASGCTLFEKDWQGSEGDSDADKVYSLLKKTISKYLD